MLILIILNATMGADRGGGWRGSKRAARALTREAARFATTADQDTSPLMAVLHMTYANAYLNAARQVGSDAALERACGVHVGELMNEIEDKQEAAVAQLTARCPKLRIDSSVVRATGWMG
jgi:hypothetical protein